VDLSRAQSHPIDYGSDPDEDKEEAPAAATNSTAKNNPRQGARFLAVNLPLLQQLLQAMEGTLQQLKGKKVLFVLGRTSVGKSTLMQRLAGMRFRASTYKNRRVYEVDGQPHGDFEIGHEAKSKTKVIKPLVLFSERMKEEVAYVDSAGFADSTGVEVDIATSLRALRLVVLVSCTAFYDARGSGVRALMDIIRKFGKNWETHRLSFTFLFTHTDHLRVDQQGDLSDNKLVLSMLTELSEKTEITQMTQAYGTMASVKDVLKWIVHCLTKGWTHLADIFHPLDGEQKVVSMRASMERFEPAALVGETGKLQCHALGLMPNETCASVICSSLRVEASSKLVLEINDMADDLDDLMRGNDTSTLLSRLEMLGYLHHQLQDVPDVKNATTNVIGRVRGHVRDLVVKARQIMLSGTDVPPAAGTDPLSGAGASLVLQNLRSASELSRLLSSVGLAEGEESPVDKVEKLFLERLSSLVDVARALPSGIPSQSGDPKAQFASPLPKGICYCLECSNASHYGRELARIWKMATNLPRKS